MNWKQFWEKQSKHANLLQQVGRKGGLAQQPESFLKEYAAYIANQLQLNKNDVLLDVCCGNGLLTHYLAKYCNSTLGLDFSEAHIEYAHKYYANETVQFMYADALNLAQTALERNFTKATLCFSFQYFETVQQGLQVMRGMVQHGVTHILITDIPDRRRFFAYYNSPIKLLRLMKQMLLQQNDMGKFWSATELNWITKQLDANGTKIIQPDTFPYAHYRMDYLINTSEVKTLV